MPAGALNSQGVGLLNSQGGSNIGSENSRTAQIAALGHPGGGIYCVYPDCWLENSCTKGHIECTYLLCKACCQKAAFSAQVASIKQVECSECRHRHKGKNVTLPLMLASAHAGTSALSVTNLISTPTSQLSASSSTASMQLPANVISSILFSLESVLVDENKALCTSTQPLAPSDFALLASQTALPASHSEGAPFAFSHACPISMLWQKTPPEWIEKLRASADAKD